MGAMASNEEEAVRRELLERHPKWAIGLELGNGGGQRRWVIRDRAGELLARHMDIVLAGETAEGRRP